MRQSAWHDPRVSESVWDLLTQTELELMICAREASGVLAYACSNQDGDGEAVSDKAVSELVLGLVDRGWVEVCRFEPWTAPDGGRGLQLGASIPRGDLGEVLADPATWDDPADVSWVGAVTLRETEEWLKLSRRAPEAAG